MTVNFKTDFNMAPLEEEGQLQAQEESKQEAETDMALET